MHEKQSVSVTPPMTTEQGKSSNNNMAEEQATNLRNNRILATQAINQTAQKDSPMTPQWTIGQQVWLDGKNLPLPYGTIKLAPRRYGPFTIDKIISPVAYRLRLPIQWNIHPVFHASLLTPYIETDSHSPNFSHPPPDLIKGENEYEVETIRKHRLFGKNKKLQYLLKWKGYPESDNTWEPVEQLHAPQLLKDYHSRHPLTSIKTLLTQRRKEHPLFPFSPLQSWNSIPTATLTSEFPHLSLTHPARLCRTSLSTRPTSPLPPHRPSRPRYQSLSTLSPPQSSLLIPRCRRKPRSTYSPPSPTLMRPSEPSPMDSSPPSTTARSSTPYSLRAYRTPMRPYKTASRTSNARLTVSSSSSPSVPSDTRTTTGVSPHRYPLEEGTTPTPNGSSSATTDASTSSSGRTSTKSPTPPTFTSTRHIQMRSLHRSLAGSATYSPVPLPLTTPYARQYLISTTGTPSQRSNDTVATTITAEDSPTSSSKSRPNSSSSTTPSLPPVTDLKRHEFLLSFLTSKDAPSRSPIQDVELLTSVAGAAALTMDREIQTRREGDVIASYRRFDVRAVSGRKRKSPGD